jgi:hypothetical protein
MKLLALNILAALALSATALSQTYRAVTADTNNVIRTNFTLAFPQVTFPGGSSNSVPVVNGGTGATNAAGALVNLLPSYTGNSNKVLGLNSNATAIIWTTNGGGGGGGTGIDTRVTTVGGVNLSTVLSTTNFTTNMTGPGFVAGSGATLQGLENGAAVGEAAIAEGPSFAGGQYAGAYGGGAAAGDAAFATNGSGAIGKNAVAYGGAFAGGSNAVSTNGGAAIGRSSTTYGEGGAVGRGATATGGAAVGRFAYTIDGAALGKNAIADGTNVVQLGDGENDTENTIQFLEAGLVDVSEWGSLANAGTIGTNLLQSTNVASAQATIFPATTTNAPTNTNAPTPDAWLDVTVGTNDYKLPLWQ